uniref:hypothetical protein n=1 Tax=Actinoplanes sp. CA-084688 TaxID=3239901 RepID=UPI003F4950F5
MSDNGAVEWVRRWRYELRWDPGHRGGVLSRDVDTVAQLHAVVRWALANPNVIGYRYYPVDYLEGEPATRCPAGHALGQPDPRRPGRVLRSTRRYPCGACQGHDVSACPTCGATVIEPAPAAECAALSIDVSPGRRV